MSRRQDLRYPRKGRRFRPRWPKLWEEPLRRAITVDVLGLDLAVQPEPKQAERALRRPRGHERERTNWRSRQRTAARRS